MTGLHDDRCATRKGYVCNCAMAAFNPPTGCDVIHATVARVTSEGKDRRVLTAAMKELTRGIANKAAKAAAEAAERGEI